jgi:hypothetical protein
LVIQLVKPRARDGRHRTLFANRHGVVATP